MTGDVISLLSQIDGSGSMIDADMLECFAYDSFANPCDCRTLIVVSLLMFCMVIVLLIIVNRMACTKKDDIP